jgi:peptidyl-tRNA hydrolase
MIDQQLTGGGPLLADRAAALAGLLAPLRERQTRWAAGELDDEPEDPAQVWAQPLVVRLERATPPDRLAALSAAATASLSVLADPRASAEWDVACRTWIAGRIRKVARRARGAHWQAAADLPGVTVAVGDAQVRAFPPYPVAETPYELRRLQVSGTELPDLAAAPVGAPGAPVFWLNSGARMSAGKAMAQVGHAGMLLAAFASAGELAGWLAAGLPVTVRDADAARWARRDDEDRGSGGRGLCLPAAAGWLVGQQHRFPGRPRRRRQH